MNGGELLSKHPDESNWYLVTTVLWNCPKMQYVIDDKYVEFRKALAEGKIVQEQDYYSKQWFDMKTPDFHGASDTQYEGVYRIKPEEPKFKIGAWVRDLRDNGIFQINSENFNLNLSITNGVYELWQPKLGEWCWFWNDSFDVPIFAKLISIDSVFGRPLEYKVKTPSYLSETTYNYMSNIFFKHCEPFIGELPTNLKDSK